MKSDIINNAISSILAKQEAQGCPISKAFIEAIQEYVRHRIQFVGIIVV